MKKLYATSTQKQQTTPQLFWNCIFLKIIIMWKKSLVQQTWKSQWKNEVWLYARNDMQKSWSEETQKSVEVLQ